MGERFLKHPPKSQIERVFGGSTNFNFRIRECRPVFVGQSKDQFYWTNSTGPILLDQFYWTSSTGPVLLDQFYWTSSTGPILLDQFGTNFYWTNLAPILLDQFY